MLAQVHILFPPRLAQQVIWSRFVNTTGLPGRNIPCDLHTEHLNRICKTAVAALGANVTPKALVRIGKCADVLLKATHNFDAATGITTQSGAHTSKPFGKGLTTIVKELVGSKVFVIQTQCFHKSFKAFRGSLLESIDKKDLEKWMKEKLDDY